MAKHHAALVGEPAHQPVRLDRVPKPGFGPAVRYTGLNGARRHLAAVSIEQRQLAARLRQASLQVPALRFGRPHGRRRFLASIAKWILTTHEQDRSIIRLKVAYQDSVAGQIFSPAAADDCQPPPSLSGR